MSSLETLANRGYTDGFYQRHHTAEHQNYMRGYSESAKSQYVGDIVGFDAARQMAEISVKNRFVVGDRLELLLPSGNRVVQLERMENLEGEAIDAAPGSGWTVRIPLPPGDFSQGLVARFVS
jgi:putative protease